MGTFFTGVLISRVSRRSVSTGRFRGLTYSRTRETPYVRFYARDFHRRSLLARFQRVEGETRRLGRSVPSVYQATRSTNSNQLEPTNRTMCRERALLLPRVANVAMMSRYSPLEARVIVHSPASLSTTNRSERSTNAGNPKRPISTNHSKFAIVLLRQIYELHRANKRSFRDKA